MQYTEMRKELTDYYYHKADARARDFYERCIAELDRYYEEGMSVYAMKRLQYRVITERMDPVIFAENPFYYETGTLAAHCDGARDFRGHKSAAGWVYWKNLHRFVDQDPELFQLVTRQKKEKMYLICGPYNDTTQHFCFNYRPVLKNGLKGLYERAAAELLSATDETERDFLSSVCEGMLSLKTVSEKFAKKAAALAETATDENAKKNFARMADAAARVPWEAPQTFYEALNTYAFLRKAIGSLEGIGFSSFGRLDLDLYPFYENDLRAGRLTEAEAYDLIARFLLMFDCHYDHDMPFVRYADHELENTYMLGGCDRDGNPVSNALSMMFLRATREEKIIFPKITLRYSQNTPKALLDEANAMLLGGTSVILYQNDDATIPALLRMGRTLEEARDYIIFGCWAVLCCGVEKPDDGNYVNLIKPIELAVHRDTEKMEEIGMQFGFFDDAESFEEVYRIACENIFTLIKERVRIGRAGGNIWDSVDVLPLYSSTLDNCIASHKDFTAGGAKYRDEHHEMFAFGNVVDSLLAIKELCFDTKRYTLREFLDAVRNNWEGCEEMRIDAMRCHGWGDGSEASCTLSAQLNEDMDRMLQSLTGAYGGKVYLGHLAYTEVRWWGEVTRATPDGRKNGEYLAQGLTPSRLNKIPNMTDVVYSMSRLNRDLFAGNSVINLMLPAAKMNLDTLEAFLRATTYTAVQSLQLNCTSKEQLLDAQKHPEKYPDLVVRVTGFSAKFTSLSSEWQQEVITRNFYEG